MIPKNNLTLDGYRQQAGIQNQASPRPTAFVPLTPPSSAAFKTMLHRAAATPGALSAEAPAGMTLADYRVRRPIGRLPEAHRPPPAQVHPSDLGRLQLDRRATASAAAAGASGSEGSKTPAPRAVIARSINRAADKYDLPRQLLESMIQAESGFRPEAVSPAGAQGLMQLIPATARELGVDDPFDVRQNIDGGARYLRQMLDRFDGNLELALSAYNAGPGTVERYNGVVPYAETRNYVQRVLAGMLPSDASPA